MGSRDAAHAPGAEAPPKGAAAPPALPLRPAGLRGRGGEGGGGKAAACPSPAPFPSGLQPPPPPPAAAMPWAMGAAAGGAAHDGAVAAAPPDPGRGLSLPRGAGSSAASQDKLFLIKGADSLPLPSSLPPPPARVRDEQQRVRQAETVPSRAPLAVAPGLVPLSRPWGVSQTFGNGLAAASGHSEKAPAAPAAFSLALGSGGAGHPSPFSGAGRDGRPGSRLLPGRELSPEGSALPGEAAGALGTGGSCGLQAALRIP